MGMRQLANQSMFAQQTQLAPDCCGTATGRFFIPWLACIKSFLEVAITQSCNRPLASAQGTEQGGISPQWLEASIASIGVGDRATEWRDSLAERGTNLGTGQCVQITPIALTPNFRPA